MLNAVGSSVGKGGWAFCAVIPSEYPRNEHTGRLTVESRLSLTCEVHTITVSSSSTIAEDAYLAWPLQGRASRVLFWVPVILEPVKGKKYKGTAQICVHQSSLPSV